MLHLKLKMASQSLVEVLAVSKTTLKLAMRKIVDENYQLFRMLLFNPIYGW